MTLFVFEFACSSVWFFRDGSRDVWDSWWLIKTHVNVSKSTSVSERFHDYCSAREIFILFEPKAVQES